MLLVKKTGFKYFLTFTRHLFCCRTNCKQQAVKKSIALVQVTLCLAVAIKLMKQEYKKKSMMPETNADKCTCLGLYFKFLRLGSSHTKN